MVVMENAVNDREDKLVSAKKKLKHFQKSRQQHVASSVSTTASIDSAMETNTSTPATSPPPARLGFHQHRKSLSKSKANGTNRPPPVLTPNATPKFGRSTHPHAAVVVPLPSSSLWSNPGSPNFPTATTLSSSTSNREDGNPPFCHGRVPSHARRASRSGHGHRRSKGSSISLSVKEGAKLHHNLRQRSSLSGQQVIHQPRLLAPSALSGPAGGSSSISRSPSPINRSPSPLSQPKDVSNQDFPARSFVFPRAPVSSAAAAAGSGISNRNHDNGDGGNNNINVAHSRVPSARHNRTQSRHRRVSSVSNRRDSLSLMGGLNVPGARSTASSGVSESERDDDTASDTDGEGNASVRKGALRALEGRLRQKTEHIDLEEASDASPHSNSRTPKGGLAPSSPNSCGPPSPLALPVSNTSGSARLGSNDYSSNLANGHARRNNSWGSGSGVGLPGTVSAACVGLGPGVVGGKGANELGMLLEEEEDELEAEVEPEHSYGDGEAEEPRHSRRGSTKARQSLNRRFSGATGEAKIGTPTSALTSLPADEPTSYSNFSISSINSNQTSSSFAESTESDALGSGAKRGLRSLTLSSSGRATLDGGVSPKTPGDRRRHSLLSSTSPSTSLANPGQNGSLSSNSSVAPGVESKRRSSLIASPATIEPFPPSPLRTRSSSTKRSRSSISYIAAPPETSSASASTSSAFPFPNSANWDGGGFGDLELTSDGDDDVSTLKFKLDEAHVRNAEAAKELGELSKLLRDTRVKGSEAMRKAEDEKEILRAQMNELQHSLKTAREVLEEDTATRLIEIETLRRQQETTAERLQDAEMERDVLREDIEGWRQRVADLDRHLAQEKTNGVAARESIRKLGDRISAMGASEAESAAQARLIADLQSQVFALANDLKVERESHDETKRGLGKMVSFTQGALGSIQQSPAVPFNPNQTHREGGRSDDSVPSSGSGSAFRPFSTESSRQNSGNGAVTEDTSYYTQSSDEEALCQIYPQEASYGEMGAGSRQSGIFTPSTFMSGLQTVAEEEDDELESGEVSETKGGIESQARHERRESFVKNWAFPKGPVAPLDDDRKEQEDSFFGLEKHSSLPPLPIPDSMLVLPPFLTAGLDIEDSPTPETVSGKHMRRPSSPRPLSIAPMTPTSARRTSITSTPPVARSARVHASLASLSESMATSPTTSESSIIKRLSLQGISSLFGGYVGTNSFSPTAAAIAVSASKLCSTNVDRHESFDATREPLLVQHDHPSPLPTKASSSSHTSLRFVAAGDRPTPKASPLSILDFTCGYDDIIVV